MRRIHKLKSDSSQRGWPMALGRSKQLIKQAGEHLVAAELAKRGFLATPFAGNVPDFDVIAVDPDHRAIPVQVKTISSSSWQLDAKKFINISFVGKKQNITGTSSSVSPDLIYVFVKINYNKNDEFFVLKVSDLAPIIMKVYSEFLKRNEGIRPRNHKSTHVAIKENNLLDYRDCWSVFID